jgi:hypothetical protein
MKLLRALLFLIGFPFAAHAQVDSTTTEETPLDQQIEILSENLGSEDVDLTALTENLQYYKEHPLNLNTATREELVELHLLTDIQINNLIEHRERFGALITIYELQAVEGFDPATIYMLLPYVRVTDRFEAGHFSIHEMFDNGKHEIVMRGQRVAEEQAGYAPIDSAELAESPNSRYLGSPYRLYTRYRFTYGNFVSWGVTAEKDAGEEFFRGTQKQGFDFYSAHLSIRNIGPVKSAVLGDYSLSFGQGLVAWTGYAFGKTSFTVGTKRNAFGIRPYTSVDESRFFRGAATTLRFGSFETTAFFSLRNRDANIAEADTLGNDIEILEVSSLQETGFHSTVSEYADKNAIREMAYGGNVTLRKARYSIGVTAIHSQYNVPLVRSLQLYNQFDFTGKENTIIGADYNFILRNFNFFGEAARSANGGFAVTNGVLISMDPRLAFTFHHRWFGKNFQNLYANAFAESTFPVNEQGFYFGIQAKPMRKVTLSAYYDLIVYPWMKFQIDAPSQAYDFLLQLNFTPDKRTDMYVRYRHRDKFINANDDDADIDFIIPFTQDNWRFNLTYPVGKSWKLKNRIEYTRYYPSNGEAQHGLAIYQDVTFKKIGFPVSVTARYALFQTDSYNARIYAYENDVPLAFSIPAYFGKGSRIFLLVNWDVTRKLELWLRVAQTFYYNQDVISEGSLTEIQSNHKTEVKLQMRFKF